MIDDLKEKFSTAYKFLKGKHVARGLSGDVYEISIREALRKSLPGERVRVGHGMLSTADGLQRSRQLDIIIHKADEGQLFSAGSEFGIWSPDAALAVIEVKGYIGPSDLKSVRINLDSVKKLNSGIKRYCFVISPPGRGTFGKFQNQARKLGIDGLYSFYSSPGGPDVQDSGGFMEFLKVLGDLIESPNAS